MPTFAGFADGFVNQAEEDAELMRRLKSGQLAYEDSIKLLHLENIDAKHDVMLESDKLKIRQQNKAFWEERGTAFKEQIEKWNLVFETAEAEKKRKEKGERAPKKVKTEEELH